MKRPSRRVLAISGTALAVAAVAAAVPVLADGGDGPTAARPPSPAHGVQPFQPTTHIDRLVVRNGATVLGQGKVLALPGRPVRFCAPLLEAGVGGVDTRYDYCRVGLDVTGVDLDQLSGRSERKRDGAVAGSARLVGTYRNGKLAVTDQTRPTRRMFDDLPTPPCDAPEGGWPSGRKNDNIEMDAVLHYKRAHPGSVVDIANLRPSDHQVVAYVVAANDPAPVRAALRSHYGKRLCVVQSRWTPAELAEARRAVDALGKGSPADGLARPMGTGRSLGEDGQPQVFADMLLVTPYIARRLDKLPSDIVALDAWLVPQ